MTSRAIWAVVCFAFFLEPVVQSINHFVAEHADVQDISMIGKSGGGWTAHLAAALDERIDLSIPIAGSLPLYARPSNISHDTEQFYAPLFGEIDTDDDGISDTADGVASWLEIFALGGYGKGRRQIQVLNFEDSCCFGTDVYETYDDFVSNVVDKLGHGDWDFHSDRTHKSHVISAHVLEKVIAPALAPAAAKHEATAMTIDKKAPAQIERIQAPFKMPKLKRPVFKNQTFNISDYGAKPDGTTKNTGAFKKAIDACSAAAGGKVLVPKGKWFTGPIHLKSNVNLHFEEGAELHFSDDPDDYLPVVFTRWAGFELMNYSPLIYARDCENIAITGPGKLYGHGKAWWGWKGRDDKVARIIYETQVLKNVPPEKRIHGTPESALRPQFFNPVNCKNVLFEGFTVAAPGPFWTFDILYCENVIVRGLRLHTVGGPNTDGININSTRNALVEYCHINAGDDCVALKSGINEDGWRVGRPTENVVIRHIKGLRSHGGIVIGSDMSGDVPQHLCA